MNSGFNISKKINQLIVAFCGPSTCGKSSVIKEILNSNPKNLHQIKTVVLDHFFYDNNKLPKTKMRGKKVSNLDLKESIDWDAFYRCISKIDTPIIFIDGFITFADERSNEIVDICVLFEYNIETDFQIALNRRIHRNKNFANCIIPNNYLKDPFSNRLNYSCTYFHDIVWPEMVKHPEYRKPKNWSTSILNLSATDSFQTNFTKAMSFLQEHIEFYIQ